MDGMMRLSRRWAVMAVTAVAGMGLAIAASAAPRNRDAAAPGLAYAPGAGFEAGSVLLTAPRTGAPILIWSQDDGYSRKLVFSRFSEKKGWSAPRAITFGVGDDLAPAAGISSTGSVLYWVDDRGRVFYAPFDAESGSLHAVPRPVSLGAMAVQRPRIEGTTDVPIILTVCDPTTPVEPCLQPTTGGGTTRSGLPPQISPDGASDAPITLTTGGTQTNGLTVASHPACGVQVLAASSGDGLLDVMMFDGAGRSTSLGRFLVDPDADKSAAAATLGAFYLRATCR